MEQEPVIIANNVHFSYPASESDGQKIIAVENVSIQANKGKHISILGRNGSGKSTLAKMINALEVPEQGEIIVFGLNTSDQKLIWSVRQACGMVFQNPDNQIVGTVVEEDVAFGPENLGVPSSEIRCRVNDALATVGLSEYALKSPTQLSGGQKQKLAIAGILAMRPRCIILDEATSMLDPRSSADLMNLTRSLQHEYGITILEITHDIENAMNADYIYIMQQGKIFFSGTPREVFTRPDKVLSAGLDLPAHLYINYLFEKSFAQPKLKLFREKFSNEIFTPQETATAMLELSQQAKPESISVIEEPVQKLKETIINVENLSFTYQRKTDFAVDAVKDISFSVNRGEIISVVGHSGSGKSTLISHLNGLIVPQQGKVEVLKYNTHNKKDIRKIRKHLGLLFQYPEHQLFENTVFDDIAFGPKQFGIEEPELSANVKQAMDVVGLPQNILQRSPFELSGGQQRRVAIAGVLATDCDIYVLDEPAAGLDPIGKKEIFDYISYLRKLNKTIILVTHDMELAAETDRILVLSEGELVGYDTVENIFTNTNLISKAGLEVPAASKFADLLSEKFNTKITGFTKKEVTDNLITFLKECDQNA